MVRISSSFFFGLPDVVLLTSLRRSRRTVPCGVVSRLASNQLRHRSEYSNTVGLHVLLGDKFPLHSRNFTNGIGGGGTGSILTSGLCTVRRPSAKLHGTPIADSIISMSQRTLYSRRRTARALDTPSDAPMKHFCTAVTHSMPNAESAHGIHSVQWVIWY